MVVEETTGVVSAPAGTDGTGDHVRPPSFDTRSAIGQSKSPRG